MTLWHANTERLEATALTAAVAKTVYTAAGLMGLGLGRAERDTSG